VLSAWLDFGDCWPPPGASSEALVAFAVGAGLSLKGAQYLFVELRWRASTLDTLAYGCEDMPARYEVRVRALHLPYSFDRPDIGEGGAGASSSR